MIEHCPVYSKIKAQLFGASSRWLVFVANVQSNDVSVINLPLLRAEFHVPVGESPYAIAHDPDKERIFVTNQHESSLSVIDLKKRRETDNC